jgi:hypothetical protein
VYPIGTHFNVSALVETAPPAGGPEQASQESYLTVFQSDETGPNVGGHWQRHWTLLDVHTLFFWDTQKDAKDHRPPVMELSLAQCRGAMTVRKVPRSECSRANTLVLQDSAGSAILKVAADNKVRIGCLGWAGRVPCRRLISIVLVGGRRMLPLG